MQFAAVWIGGGGVMVVVVVTCSKQPEIGAQAGATGVAAGSRAKLGRVLTAGEQQSNSFPFQGGGGEAAAQAKIQTRVIPAPEA